MLQTKDVEQRRRQLHVRPHQLDGVGAVLLRELPRSLLYLGVSPGLQPQETDLAVAWAALARLKPLPRPLLERRLRPSLLSHRDGLHQPQVYNVLLQLEVELLGYLSEIVQRIQADYAWDTHIVLPLQGGLEDPGLVATEDHAQGGSVVELAAQRLPHGRRGGLVGEQHHGGALGVVEPLAQSVLVLEGLRVVGHQRVCPLPQVLDVDRAQIEDLGRRLLVLGKPTQSWVLGDRSPAACFPLLSAVHRRDLEEVPELGGELRVLGLCLHAVVVVRLVKHHDPGLVPLVDVGLVDVAREFRDVRVVVDVRLRSGLALLHEHHLAATVDDPDVAVWLPAKELPEHGLGLVVGLRPLL
mmetsp:Transcript_2032/g.5759  ORF Transcript_2032/g.5759 Transcript_2032/m.5759 type:complete len:355 (-) Transcript_2032:444-1508(-)